MPTSAPGITSLCAALCAASLSAQSPFPQNKLEFGNFWIAPREDPFPNYLSAGGNLAGDGLFKVFPEAVLERHEAMELSGYRLTFSVDDAFTGSFPVVVDVPGVQLFATTGITVAGQAYEAMDPAQPIGPIFDPIPVVLSGDASWEIEVRFDPAATTPSTRQLLSIPSQVNGSRRGLAALVRATPGQTRSAIVPGVVMLSSFAERHLLPGRPSHSGSFDAATGGVAMYGTTGQPSASGELAVALRFANPTLQLFADTAGGLVPDPQGFETHMGPGAYATDLAGRNRAGFFGFFVQAEQYDPQGGAPTHLVLPFVVAQSLSGPSATLGIGGASMRYAPGEEGLANLFIGAGQFGALDVYRAGGPAGFDRDQTGAWSSSRISFPASPHLAGIDLWIQGMIVDAALFPVANTNAVRLTLR